MRLVPDGWIPALILLAVLPIATARSDDAKPSPAVVAEQERFFETSVRPALVAHCLECHGPKREGGLRLDSREAMLAGNDTGPAILPGKPDQSRLLTVIRYAAGDTQMPPKGKLPDETIAALTEWVKIGAPWPATSDLGGKAAVLDPDAWRRHWAFRRVRRPIVPAVRRGVWPQSPVDRFVLATLESHGLEPSPEADRRALLRRLSFDLVGMPPTFEETEAFVADPSPDAYERVVDRLLASPQFGEKWARHWLDVARYADTKGYVFNEDRNYPDAWRYRDWVIAAFNDDLPFDRFVTLQLAADRVAPDDANALAAMGFLTLGRRFLNNRQDILDDRIDVVTRGLMGFTVTCARCHDHKFDPIPTADYYSLYGVFDSSDEPKNAPSALRLVDAAQPREPVVFVRGNQGNRGDRVPRQFPMALSPAERKPFTQGSGRLELAAAIASPDNPLTARVFANRVWGRLFGQGLVSTPSDFGVRSDPPTHPELLDWLAFEFSEGAKFGDGEMERTRDGVKEGQSEGEKVGAQASLAVSQSPNPQSPSLAGSRSSSNPLARSIKRLIRAIVVSAAYRQSSMASEAAIALDPENRLIARQNRRRLDFEAQRDAFLFVSGALDGTMGGPSVPIAADTTTPRRTVYAFIDRQNLPGLFRTFDFASPDTHAPQRFTTTVPQQALFLMNHPFALDQSRRLAAATRASSDAVDAGAVRAIHRRVFAREPDADEIALGVDFLASSSDGGTVATSEWSCGFGEIDVATGRMKSFAELPHWTGSAWQGGPQLPDPKHGWASLTARGGHPGDNPAFAVVRRWTAPADVRVRIAGRLDHPSDKGDGVRGRIVTPRDGTRGDWTAKKGVKETAVADIELRRGETLDFVTDCRKETSYDSFEWKVRIEASPLKSENAAGVALRRSEWNSESDHHGPQPPSLTAWERYAQALLLSNEFSFVD